MQPQGRGSAAPTGTPRQGQPRPGVSPTLRLAPSRPCPSHSCSSSGREKWGSPSQELCQGKPSPAQGCCQQSPAARPGPVLPVGMQQADSSFCAVPSSGDTQCIKRRSRSGLFSKGEMASYQQGGDQVSFQTRAQHPHLAVAMPEDAQLALAPQLWVLWDGGNYLLLKALLFFLHILHLRLQLPDLSDVRCRLRKEKVEPWEQTCGLGAAGTCHGERSAHPNSELLLHSSEGA